MRSFLARIGLLDAVTLIYHTGGLVLGWIVFWFTHETPAFGRNGLIATFCRTQGRFNDLQSWIIRRMATPRAIPVARGVLGSLTAADVADVAQDIAQHGYHVFSQTLSPEMCQRLRECAFATPARLVSVTAPDVENVNALQVYDRARPLAVRYDCEPDELLKNEVMQELVADESLMAVAQAYLQSRPVIASMSIVCSTAQVKPDVAAAQFFHFDMDGVQWLNYFIYLTDVTERSGPHEFVEGSHVAGGIPRALLRRGYARLPDADVRAHYASERFITFTGKAGTIVAEDTRGLHKGHMVQEGDRLMAGIEFTNSLFGNPSPHFVVPAKRSAALQAAITKYPHVYRAFDV